MSYLSSSIFALLIGLSLGSANAAASQIEEFKKEAKGYACYEGYDTALAKALASANEQANSECGLPKGVLQLVSSHDISIQIGNESGCEVALVSIKYKCLLRNQ